MITGEILAAPSFFGQVPHADDVAQLVELVEGSIDIDLTHGVHLDVGVLNRESGGRFNPVLRFATAGHAQEIVDLYRELYEGSYPYKEMEDVEYVRQLIESPNLDCILFFTPSEEIAGCVKFSLDFANKRGYIRGFMVKKEFHKHIDVVKAFLGAMLALYITYRKEILLWYVENRTAHSSSQYPMHVAGVRPIAFFPNKDIFLGKVESDLMQVLYSKEALYYNRSDREPILIPEVMKCYQDSQQRYGLGGVRIAFPKMGLDSYQLSVLSESVEVSIDTDDYDYHTITLTLEDSDSYFKFLYSPQVQNFEKTEYKVNTLEELFVFIQQFRSLGRRFSIRYCEIFVSAYEPAHQRLFYDVFGLVPRGYIPSWKFNSEEQVFEDSILFNYFEGVIDTDICLIDEGIELLACLDMK